MIPKSYTRDILIRSSECDAGQQLGIRNTFLLFQDMAMEHAEYMGVGFEQLLAENACWVLAHSRIRFHRRPRMEDCVSVKTWPVKPEHVRYVRYFSVTQDDEVIMEGKTDWTIIDMEKRTIRRREGTSYPMDMEYLEDEAAGGPFRRWHDDFCAEDFIFETKIRSSSIDLSGHTNNAEYVRIALDTLPVSFYGENHVREIEIDFRKESYEGETLEVFSKQEDNVRRFAIKKADGTVSAFISLVTEKK